MNFAILHSDLPEEEKAECMQIMRQGNDLMKAWAEEYFGKKNHAARFRRGLFLWVDQPEGFVGPRHKDAIDPNAVGIPPSVLEVMLRVRKIESRLLFGYVRMIVNIAKRCRWAIRFTYLDMDDLLLEGMIALREAIYSFSREDACFTTYAHWVIRRHLFRKINQASDQGVLGASSIKLLESFHQRQRSLEKQFGYKPSWSTTLSSMNLTSEQENHLESLFRRFVRSSQLQDIDQGNLYENLADDQSAPDLDMLAFERAIEFAPITEIQRELIRAALKGDRVFRSRIIEKHINPKTNKPYSRMSATNMLRKAYQIVQRELSKAA